MSFPRGKSRGRTEKLIRFLLYIVIGYVPEVSKCSLFLRNFFNSDLVQKKYQAVSLFGS